MVFEAFKITPVLKLDSAQTEPGATIEGTLYVTSTSETPINVSEIWLEFKGECNTTARSNRTSCETGFSGSHGECRPLSGESNPHCEADARSVTPPSLRGTQASVRAQPNAGDGSVVTTGQPVRNSDECLSAKLSFGLDDASNEIGFGHNDAHRGHGECYDAAQPSAPRTARRTVAHAKTALRTTPTQFTRGVHQLPFSITVPREHEGEPLPPSFDSSELRTSVQYAVTGTLKLSALTWRSSKSRVCVRRSDASNPGAPSRVVELQRGIRVGTWYKESLQLWQLVKYYLGGDTAARWTEATLHMTQKDMPLQLGLPTYLQDYVTLSVQQQSGSEMPLYVDSVRVYLLTTTAVHPESRGRVIRREHELEILDARGIDYPVDSSEKGRGDISAVLSGARIPATVPPTITLPSIQVQHWIRITVGVRGASPDGTRQGVAQAELRTAVGLFNA